jgi:hypothetical protein
MLAVCAALAEVGWAFAPVWAAGLHGGTLALPNTYPVVFPPRIAQYDFDDDGQADDVDGDGVADQTTLVRGRGDVVLGGELWYWVGGAGRVGLTGDLGLAQRQQRVAGLLQYQATWDTGAAMLLLGGGVGAGDLWLRGSDPDERLRVPHFPLRVTGGVIIPPTDFFAIEGRLFGQLDIPSRHVFTDLAGMERAVSGVPFYYGAVGVELAVCYGRFD